MKNHVQVEAGAQNVFTEPAGFIRVSDCLLQAAVHVQHFTAQVDESVVSSDSPRGDRDAFQQYMRISHQQWNIFTRSGLSFVSVHHKVARATIMGREECPLQSRRETCSTASTQAS